MFIDFLYAIWLSLTYWYLDELVETLKCGPKETLSEGLNTNHTLQSFTDKKKKKKDNKGIPSFPLYSYVLLYAGISHKIQIHW